MKVFFCSVLKVPLMVHFFYLNGNVQTNAQWENSTNKSRKTGHIIQNYTQQYITHIPCQQQLYVRQIKSKGKTVKCRVNGQRLE